MTVQVVEPALGAVPDHSLQTILSPFDPRFIRRELAAGKAVRVWAIYLRGWVWWVPDEETKFRIASEHPGELIYTRGEMELLLSVRPLGDCMERIKAAFGRSFSAAV